MDDSTEQRLKTKEKKVKTLYREDANKVKVANKQSQEVLLAVIISFYFLSVQCISISQLGRAPLPMG